MNLSGRKALITGASQGIGRACARKLASCGASVALLARNQEKLEELAREIAPSGVATLVAVADLEDEAQIQKALKTVLGEFGKLEILVNNAGMTRDQLLLRMKRADWDKVVNTNLTSAYLCTHKWWARC